MGSTQETAHKPVVLIPAFQPGKTLAPLVRELAAAPEIGVIIVVDDGSGPEFGEVFREIAEDGRVQVLRHVVNLGKGAALKTGMNHAACLFPDSVGVVTADADGQHSPQDVRRVAAALAAEPERLILGARTFDAAAPWRSRVGNRMTRSIMRAVTGQRLSDTQTGLRGVPMDFIPELLKLRATGYEFELDMLVTCRNTARPIRELPISTIYIEGNRSSHFNPLTDSMRIYFIFVRFLAVSLTTAGIDNVVFIFAMWLWTSPLLCQAISRFIAGTFQFTAVKRGVFHSRARNVVAAPKYILTTALSGALSYMLIHNLVAFAGMGVVPAKLLAETTLFFFSFVIQRDFVFSQKSDASA